MNTDAFEDLIDIYSDFTALELEEFWQGDGRTTMLELTGFSSPSRCTLCKAASKLGYEKCNHCLYTFYRERVDKYACLGQTYDEISDSETPEELYKALQKRIKFMKEVLTYYKENV